MANKYIRHGATYNGDGLTSAVASGSTVTFTIASPGKVNWTGHGLAANDLVYFGVTTGGALPTGITAGTTYYVRNPGTNDFEVSATSGGASINFSGTPSGTASCTTTGAWNHIDIMYGTAVNTITGGTQGGGSISANDTIHIRSKSEAGADITVDHSSATLVFGATVAATWAIDNGAVWSGINGIVTFTTTSHANGKQFRTNQHFYAAAEDALVFKTTSTTANTLIIASASSCFGSFTNAVFDGSGATNFKLISDSGYGNFVFNNCKFLGATAGSQTNPLIEMKNGTNTLFINPRFVLGVVSTAIFSFSSGPGARGRIIGGSVTGAGATTGSSVISVNSIQGNVEFAGLQYPKTMRFAANDMSSSFPSGTRSMGADGGTGSVLSEVWGEASSRLDEFFPYLNARLPDSSATGWSWKIYPTSIGFGRRTALVFAKFFTDTADEQTVTQELLIANNNNSGTYWDTLFTTSTAYITVSYTDNATGLVKTVTSEAADPGSALTTSTADWSATTYSSSSFVKRKITVTTPTAVKQNTMVFVTLVTRVTAVSANDIFFACPDPQVAAAV